MFVQIMMSTHGILEGKYRDCALFLIIDQHQHHHPSTTTAPYSGLTALAPDIDLQRHGVGKTRTAACCILHRANSALPLPPRLLSLAESR